ncbi:MAG: FIST N-terminal domain-containing protein, partial [Porticoccus sp.]|nr:FIST N-terminal domain-containing protein [Porticoccus sp.]
MTTDDAISSGSDSLNILTGVSTSRDSIVAASELYEHIYQPDIELCLFYCSPEYDLKALGDELNRLFGDINLIGCTTSGEITPEGYYRNSLTGVSMSGDGIQLVTQRLDDIDQFEISHGIDATRLLKN